MRNSFYADLGTDVTAAKSAEEAIVLGGLDWDVLAEPLVVQLTEKNEEGEQTSQLVPMPHNFVTYRKDTKDILGLVGDKYNIIQNRRNFTVMDDIAETTQAKYVSVGKIGAGHKIFMIAELPGDLQVVGQDDTIKKYLRLMASHDGKSSVIMSFSPVHTLSRAVIGLSRTGLHDKVSVRHTSTNEKRLNEATRLMKMADNYFGELENIFTGLAKVPFTASMMDTLLDTVMPNTLDSKAGKTRTENSRSKLTTLFNTSEAIVDSVKGTAWAAFVACAEYADFGKTFSGNAGKSTAAENRFLSVSEGTAYDFKNEAFNKIADIAGV